MQRFMITSLVILIQLALCPSVAYSSSLSDEEILTNLKSLFFTAKNEVDQNALNTLDKHWEDGMIAPLVEIERYGVSEKQIFKINRLLRKKTGENYLGYFEWLEWMWETKPPIEPYYFEFKAVIHGHIDAKFPKYFRDRTQQTSIRLDEVVWGGVKQDGIPPLRNPKLLQANEATYLADSDIVFGAYINGVAKAYPKRVLAWHEMFIDQFGDDLICGVYCTLCGTVIAYDTKHNGTTYHLGTSGFLYRSNKLMYDKTTQSLWNTIEGKPVLGPLFDKGIELKVLPIVTTTWGEWKALHPATKVLSLETGHRRDYGEGVAYQKYFATDELMFPVPKLNRSLANKQEVLVLRTSDYEDNPLAISIKYLKKKKWFRGKIGSTRFIVIAEKSGAARVYESNTVKFKSYKKGVLLDNQGGKWNISHDKLTGPDGTILNRLPSHNTFWFAWYNAYPETKLVK